MFFGFVLERLFASVFSIHSILLSIGLGVALSLISSLNIGSDVSSRVMNAYDSTGKGIGTSGFIHGLRCHSINHVLGY